MRVSSAIRARRSARRFSSRAIPEKALRQVGLPPPVQTDSPGTTL